MAEQEVSLSNGSKVTVGRLSWKGYKAIKNLIAVTISGPILTQTISVVTGPIGGILSDLLGSVVNAIAAKGGPDDAQADLMSRLGQKWSDASTAAMVLQAMDQLKISLGSSLIELLTKSDEFTEMLIIHSARKVVSSDKPDVIGASDMAETFTFDDVQQLRDKALEINPLEQLLEMEKNWWGRLISVGKTLAGTQTSNSPGTPTSNTGSLQPTTGQ